MTPLLVAIGLWLATNFNLPIPAELPNVELATTSQIETLRYGVVRDALQTGDNQTVAVYVDDTKTIYLPAN